MTAPAQPMLARRMLRLAVVHKLRAAMGGGITISSPGVWPTPMEKLPALLVRMPQESKQSITRTMPEFTTSMTLEILGQVSGATPEAAQDAIEDLAYQVENAVLTGYWINAMVQQFASINTDVEISSEGKTHLAGFKMSVVCETFEAFDPTQAAPGSTTWPLDDPVTVALQGVDLHADMQQPFDAAGTYTGSVFPQAVAPAPRTSGPDGRDEGALQIDLPQT